MLLLEFVPPRRRSWRPYGRPENRLGPVRQRPAAHVGVHARALPWHIPAEAGTPLPHSGPSPRGEGGRRIDPVDRVPGPSGGGAPAASLHRLEASRALGLPGVACP